MAVFYRSVSTPEGPASPTGETNREIRWWTVAAFVTVLLILILFAYFSGQNEKLQLLYSALVHGIEVLIGLFAGIFIGESNK
jgi:hypothetical protein